MQNFALFVTEDMVLIGCLNDISTLTVISSQTCLGYQKCNKPYLYKELMQSLVSERVSCKQTMQDIESRRFMCASRIT